MSSKRIGVLAALALVACGEVDDGSAPAEETQRAQQASAPTTPAPSADPPAGNPAEVYVRNVVLRGKGCYAWSGFAQKSAGQHYVRLSDYRFLFDFTRPSESFDCIASIDLHVPTGRSVAVSGWKLTGTAQVDPRAYVSFSAQLGWQGLTPADPVAKRFAPGFTGVFDVTGAVGNRPCDGEERHLELDLNAEINRAADASAGHTSLQSIALLLDLDEEACPVPSR